MHYRCFGLIGWMLLAQAVVLRANEPDVVPAPKGPPPLKLALEQIPSPQRELVRDVIERAILSARGPGEAFSCNPDHFLLFLDHPERAVTAWRRLGAQCVSIVPQGQNTFGWTDENGSRVVWETVLRTPNQRVWYAQGKVKPGPLLPFVPVKAVVVLRYRQEDVRQDGTATIMQQSSIHIQTDSKSATVVTKILGNSANHMAEEGLKQLQLFFSGPSRYIHHNPDHAEMLLKE